LAISALDAPSGLLGGSAFASLVAPVTRETCEYVVFLRRNDHKCLAVGGGGDDDAGVDADDDTKGRVVGVDVVGEATMGKRKVASRGLGEGEESNNLPGLGGDVFDCWGDFEVPRAEVWTVEAPMTNSDDVVKYGGDNQAPCMILYGATAKEGDGRSRWGEEQSRRTSDEVRGKKKRVSGRAFLAAVKRGG
jgi:hypothetical protein